MFGTGEGELKRIDYGLVIGGGIGIPAGAGLIFLDARYLLGLANFSNVIGIDAGTAKNQGVNVALGILFSLGQGQ